MKNKLLLLIFTIMFVRPAWIVAGDQEPEANVNSRYTVENVDLSGIAESKISKNLRDDIKKLVGEKFNQDAVDQLAKRLRKELPEYSVTTKVQRGDKPDHVKIIFEIEKLWWKTFDVDLSDLSKIVYHSKQGWSGALIASIESHNNVFSFGFVNSADELLERNAGLRLGYEHRKLGTARLQFRMDFESYHEKWNPSTELALKSSPDVPGIYRNRQNFAPSIAFLPWRDLKVSIGNSFQRFQIQYPTPDTQTAYGGTATVSFRHLFESGSGFQHRLNAEYNLRTATRILDSDFVYTRHAVEGRYTAARGRNHFSLQFLAGRITGGAPLFERFSLGDSFNLRGWNKFDVAPLGGSRMVYASLEYQYSHFQIFYDTGSVWDAGHAAKIRHSLGFGLAEKDDGAFLLLGFPVRLHRVVPVLTLGIRF